MRGQWPIVERTRVTVARDEIWGDGLAGNTTGLILCGDAGSGKSAAARGMLEGTAATSDPDEIGRVRADLPIYLMSGDADPLAGGGELIELVATRYRDAGVVDVAVARYPEARHEILNETNRDEVTADLLAWLDRVLA